LLLLLPQPCMVPASNASEATAPTINAESFLDIAAILRNELYRYRADGNTNRRCPRERGRSSVLLAGGELPPCVLVAGAGVEHHAQRAARHVRQVQRRGRGDRGADVPGAIRLTRCRL